MRLRRSLVASLIVLAPYIRFTTATTAISVGLKPSWNGAPFLLELLETAGDEDRNSYFPLLDKIAAGVFKNDTTDEALYHRFLREAQQGGFLTDAEALASFNFALSIHSTAPRIEAHYRYYKDSMEPLMGKAYKPKCRAWLLWSQQQFCTTASIADTISTWERFPNEKEHLAFDRVLETKKDAAAAILYADIDSPEFPRFHEILSEYAKRGVITYRVRFRPPFSPVYREVLLSGYGVELALKKTDYSVMDDRDTEGQAAATKETATGKEALLDTEEISDIKPLHPKEVAFLGIKSAAFVLNSEDKLQTLLQLNQDFPKYAHKIGASEVDNDLTESIRGNWEAGHFLPGMNSLWVNGLQLDDSQLDAYSLLDILRRERKVIKSLQSFKMDTSQALNLLTHEIIAEAKRDERPQRFDYRDSFEGGNVIIWLNDLEKYERYEHWPTSVQVLLRPVHPGQIHQLKKNIHNLVVPVDLTSFEDVFLITRQLSMFVERKISVRFGFIPLLRSYEAAGQARIVYYLLENYGLETALAYLEASAENQVTSQPSKKIFQSVTKDATSLEGKTPLSFDEILTSEDVKNKVEGARKWAKRLGANSAIPPVFINGLSIPRGDDWMQQMSARLQSDINLTQRAVYEDLLKDDSDFNDMLLLGAVTRRSPCIVPEDEVTITVVDIASLKQEHETVFKTLPSLEAKQHEKLGELEIWVVGDFDEKDGYDLLQGAAEAHHGIPGVSIKLINNPELINQSPALSTLLYQLNSKEFFKSGEQLLQLLKETPPTRAHTEFPQIDILVKQEGYQPDAKAESWYFNEHAEAGKFWKSAQDLVKQIGLKPGERGLVVNGRVVGPIPRDEEFDLESVKQLVEYEREKRVEPVLRAADNLQLLDQLSPEEAVHLTNLVTLTTIPEGPQELFETPPAVRVNNFELWNHSSAITIGNKDTAIFNIVATVDATSESAQRLIPILKVLSELEGVYLRVFFNPLRMSQDLSIKRFYRYVLESGPKFGESGQLLNPKAEFHGMPVDALLTLGMDVPPAWLVTPKVCIHDLDNIKLSALKDRLRGGSVEATYELRSILIQGHARDITIGGPPKGAQLVLGTQKNPQTADTIVMANLGYFQFKANPGIWKLGMKEGASEAIFNIDSAGTKGYAAQRGDDNPEIALVSFRGATLFPRLSRKKGMETSDVLTIDYQKPRDILGYVKQGLQKIDDALTYVGILNPPKNAGKPVVKNAEINIFSVASGHLYERFLDIMMLSVMKHTNHTVKFWFIENFLSPSFKDFLPHMAKEYNFEYELVTYKWPHWLRAQKEKQREIWGYKILFLDVLFPLDLDKVIFVDADQIVRTDMKELVDLDLQGAPYGFTPMCDSRTEIEGFRFWKQGYWKNYLKGRPYHISALYVVDLKRFRQIAAGDRLRQTYHQLSADPNSLSNLDQDLPNHMQINLPIFSLPQEWLWCETWCSDESLSSAKTIDLCNNPMTKEPKLDRAKRQVPEWVEYDNEAAALAARVKREEAAGSKLENAGEPAAPVKEATVKDGEAAPEKPEARVKDEL